MDIHENLGTLKLTKKKTSQSMSYLVYENGQLKTEEENYRMPETKCKQKYTRKNLHQRNAEEDQAQGQ